MEGSEHDHCLGTPDGDLPHFLVNDRTAESEGYNGPRHLLSAEVCLVDRSADLVSVRDERLGMMKCRRRRNTCSSRGLHCKEY